MLAALYQKGYPVPEGFVVLPSGFAADALIPASVGEIRQAVAEMRRHTPGASFAVRSSALGEDSSTASFAGEFETVLNTRGDEEIIDAIHTVFQSRVCKRIAPRKA